MKVATYNVNSIRQRLPIVLDWLATYEPDILALQETKVEDSKFPLEELEEMGYHVSIHGQKSYNGLALISREPQIGLVNGFADPTFPEDCRIQMARIGPVGIVNTYVPNGTKVGIDKWEYKLRWLERFEAMCRERFRPTDPVIWMGDINIAPEPEDVYDSRKVYGGVGHHPDEFSRLNKIKEFGWVDCFRQFTSGAGHYTYFDYFITNSIETNRGWRIDHIYATQPLAAKCTACEIDMEPRRSTKPSDHTIVWAEFDL